MEHGNNLSSLGYIKANLLDKMSPTDQEILKAALSAKHPAPEWLEGLLVDVQSAKGLEIVLADMRSNPLQTIDYASNLEVASFYLRKGHSIEFLKTGSAPTPDILMDNTLDLEVKQLADTSKWGWLISEGSKIPSDYIVNVDTDVEISESQLKTILDDLKQTAAGNPPVGEEISKPWATFTYLRKTGLQHTIVIPGTLEPQDLNAYSKKMRRIVLDRLQSARKQVMGGRVKVVALDGRRMFLEDPELREEIFQGTLVDDVLFNKAGKPIGTRSRRLTDGVIHDQSAFENIDSIVVFSNGEPKSIYSKMAKMFLYG